MGEFPPGPTADQPCDISTIFETFRARIVTRSKIPGYLLEDILGERPRSRRNPDGWPNRAIDYSGTELNSDFECQNADFRFSIAKPANGRAFGDLKYGLANRRCAPDTPTKLPTWDHIGQLGIRIRRNNRNFAFFEAGHEAAYKNPPHPDRAKLFAVSLRTPTDNRRCGFLQRTLLSGDAADVFHNNIPPWIFAVIMIIFFGFPVVIYFDDYGCPTPEPSWAYGYFGKFAHYWAYSSKGTDGVGPPSYMPWAEWGIPIARIGHAPTIRDVGF